METLFSEVEDETRMSFAPLAVRMRPRTLDELVGQREACGEGSWLRRAIENDALSSIILYGPAGTGKTSLAHIIAETTRATFVEVSAIGGTVSDLRREIAAAEKRLLEGKRTILFVDEIHRFNRAQQDSLLHAVENRVVVLVGATTENPFFEVNTALNSRSRIVQLKSLTDEDIAELVNRALADERGLAGRYTLDAQALDAIVLLAGGDGRAALTTLELAADMAGQDATAENPIAITEEIVAASTPNRALPYDKNKDMHYDIISAFIKSMRGSDPDATLYWLARMVDGGEDPKFIARRIFICASEDVGNADPTALLVAEAAFKAAEVIGYPECGINLAHAATYVALAPKSNAASAGYFAALSEVKHGPARAVPDYLRDRHRPGSETYGAYKYPHDYPGGWVDQRYLPEGLERGAFYTPSDRGWEAYRMDSFARDRAEAPHPQKKKGAAGPPEHP